MIQSIIKRDGTSEQWNINKISNSIKKALSSINFDDNSADHHSEYVTNLVLSKLNGDKQVRQEYIQDLVEKSLMESGLSDAAKNYILYREKRREIRDQKQLQIDIIDTIDSYIEGESWRINENANMDYSYQGLVLNISGEIESKYCLNKYPENVRKAHLNNYFHIHDLSQGLVGYCSGWSLYDMILEGFNLKGCCSSGPPKHFDTVLSQMINFIGTLQNEWAGAQAFSSVDTLLAPFVYYDNLNYRDIKQRVQRFIYNLNTTSRWGGQCPFSNLTFDLTVPKDYKGSPVIVGGKIKDKTYDEFTDEMALINKAFLEIMKDGDFNGRIFSFPIPTYNITKEFDWDSEIGKLILEMTAKYGIPYFQNFINSDIDPTDVRSFCLDYDSIVSVEWNDSGKKEKRKIGDLVDNYEFSDYKVRTSIGYRPLKRTIKKKVEKLIEIETESGKILQMSEDHPHLVYNNIEYSEPKLEVVSAKDLKSGMFTSVYDNGNKNPIKNQYYWDKKNFEDNLNTKEKIIRVSEIDKECFVYDFEILQEEGKEKVHNFYANDILTHNCCRLQLDKRQIEKQLKHKTGGLFGSGELTGSIGVVTLNLPKYAYLSKDENEFFEYLNKYANIAKESLEFKRKMVSNNFDKGMFPWTSRYLKQKFDTYFSTIGVIGGHEAGLNLFGEGIETEKGKEFCKRILNYLRDLLLEFQEETGNMYNLEATPAEGTSYKLAKNDKKTFPDIITSGTDEPYYVNSTQLPVDLTDDVFFALEHQNELQTLYTGGTVFHTYIGQEIKDPSVIKEFITKAFTMTKMPYLSITPTFSICEDHGYLSGEHFECPYCGKESEVYTRVVGYFRPVQRFNKGKKEEYVERKTFDNSVIP